MVLEVTRLRASVDNAQVGDLGEELSTLSPLTPSNLAYQIRVCVPCVCARVSPRGSSSAREPEQQLLAEPTTELLTRPALSLEMCE